MNLWYLDKGLIYLFEDDSASSWASSGALIENALQAEHNSTFCQENLCVP